MMRSCSGMLVWMPSITISDSAYGADRKSAIARMKQALSEMVIEGIQTNIPLQLRIMRDPTFREGLHNIHYMDDMLAEWQTE